MDEGTPPLPPVSPVPASMPETPGGAPKRKMLILAIIGIAVLVVVATALVLILKKKPAPTQKKATSTSSQASQSLMLESRLAKLNACSLLPGSTPTQNSLSINQSDKLGFDDNDYPHCLWASVVNNQLQYEVEATIAIGKDTDILTPAYTPIGGQSKVGKHQTYLTLGDFGNGHGICSYNVVITDNARVELEARDPDNTFEGGCSLANQYGPVLEQSLTAKGF